MEYIKLLKKKKKLLFVKVATMITIAMEKKTMKMKTMTKITMRKMQMKRESIQMKRRIMTIMMITKRKVTKNTKRKALMDSHYLLCFSSADLW
jgi:hypothetical protein